MLRMGAPTAAKKAATPPNADQKAEKIRDQVLALDVKRVADWLQTLIKTVKASRLYLSNNPQLLRFQADLESRTWSCLKEIGDIPLTVQQFDFLFENYSVYHNADRSESLAFRFYSDGVRGITIREGLEPDELRSFLEVLRRAIDGPNGQDDVVTLLWERDFRHIEYVYIPLDELGEGNAADYADGDRSDSPSGEAIPWPVGVDEDYEDDGPSVAANAEEGAPDAEATVAAERSDDWSAHIQRSRSWERPDGIQFQIDDKERDELEHAIRLEEVRALHQEVLEIVAAILEHEEDPSGFMDSAVAFQRFIEYAIEEGDVRRAHDLLGRLQEIAAKKAREGREFAGIADRVIREIGRPSFLGQLAPTLNAHPELDPAVLTEFLVQLGPGSTPAICDLLGQVNHARHRRALCEALASTCGDDVEPLLQRLGDPRWYVIRNVVYVLGRIAHQGVERALDRALHHEDVRVRKEAVRALGNIESPTARAYLVSAFRDADAGVRIQAALTLAEKRDERGAQSLLSAIQAPEFQRRDLREKETFFEALGRAGSDALAPKLEAMLTKGGLFGGGNDEERYHAALALAWLGTPKALATLDREVKSKRDGVRTSVERALNAVRKAALASRGEAAPDSGADGGASGEAAAPREGNAS
jgi:HEAT repeat protein